MTGTTTTRAAAAELRADPGQGAVPGLEDGTGTLRPDRALLKYYLLSALLLGPGFLVVILPRYFRYHTLRYAFDDEGITMRWGILFRREVSLTYSRIQDIHLTSNLFERWLGLARIEVQTASGSAAAEMTIEGLTAFEAVRDLLYSRMRGVRERHVTAAGGRALRPGGMTEPSVAAPADAGPDDELAAALRSTAAELRALRDALALHGTADRGDRDAGPPA